MTEDSAETKSAKGREGKPGESSGVAEKTHEAAEYVRDAALSRVQSARQSAESAKESAAERVRTWGAAVRKVGEHLRVEDQHYVADKATSVGQQLDDVAEYISSAELSTLVRDGEEIAREKPLLFFGGAFVLGLAAGRFLKVSSSGVTSSRPQRTRAARRQGPAMQDEAAPNDDLLRGSPMTGTGLSAAAAERARRPGNGGNDETAQGRRMSADRGAAR
jgi:hypothetical protein